MELSGQEANEAGFECGVTWLWIGTWTVGDKGLMELSGKEANEAGFECGVSWLWIGTCTVGDKDLDDLEIGISGHKSDEQGFVWGVSRLWIGTWIIWDKEVFGLGFLFSKYWEFVLWEGDERPLSENNWFLHNYFIKKIWVQILTTWILG